MPRIKYGTKVSRSDRWTPEEDSTLLQNYFEGASYKKLMRILDRGYSGVVVRLRKLEAVKYKQLMKLQVVVDRSLPGS